MKYRKSDLNELPQSAPIYHLFGFLGELKNASVRPSDVNSPVPPVVYWWFEIENNEINKFIQDCVISYKWEDKWELETINGKWLLYPYEIKNTEKLIKGLGESHKIEISRTAQDWLKKNKPDFGYRTNKDLERFKFYFKTRIEKYLRDGVG